MDGNGPDEPRLRVLVVDASAAPDPASALGRIDAPHDASVWPPCAAAG